MNYKEEIIKLCEKNNGIVFSVELKKLNIARKYLSDLVEEGYLYHIERGIYGLKPLILNKLFLLQHHNPKLIYSHFTALKLLNFYSLKSGGEQISLPQGYNATRINEYEKFYVTNQIHQEGIMYILDENKQKIYLYELERNICSIIKDRNRFDNKEVNQLILYYFSSCKINYQKLYYYSKLFKIEENVKFYLDTFCK